MYRTRLLAGLFTVLWSMVVITGVVHSQEQDQFQKGIDAFVQGDYQTAADIWLIEAYEGSLDSQFNLGVLYLEGKGVAQSREDAIFWFIRAAKGGHVEAQYNLGHLYFENQDDPESLSQGMEWWRLASLQDYAVAQFNYGRALFYGIGAPQNLQKSRYWMERSARGGAEFAKRFLDANSEVFAGINALEDTAVIAHFAEHENKTGSVVSSVEPARQEQPTDSSPDATVAAHYEAGRSQYYVVTGDKPQPIFHGPDRQDPVLMHADTGLLLRGSQQKAGLIKVQVPGGLPGWINGAQVVKNASFVVVKGDNTPIVSDPYEQAEPIVLGHLDTGTQLLVIDEIDDAFQVLTPENLAGWIEAVSLREQSGTELELARRWLNQRLVRKDRALSSSKSGAMEFLASNLSISFQEDLDSPSRIEKLTIDEFVAQLESSFQITGLDSVAGQNSTEAPVEIPEFTEPFKFDDSIQYAARFTLAQLDDFEPILLETLEDSGPGLTSTGNDNDNVWLYSKSPEHFTLMLFSIKDRKKAQLLHGKSGEQGHLFSTVSNGSRWYFVLLGNFLSREEAESTLRNLPGWAQHGAARSFGSLQRKRCENQSVLDNYETVGLAEFCRI